MQTLAMQFPFATPSPTSSQIPIAGRHCERRGCDRRAGAKWDNIKVASIHCARRLEFGRSFWRKSAPQFASLNSQHFLELAQGSRLVLRNGSSAVSGESRKRTSSSAAAQPPHQPNRLDSVKGQKLCFQGFLANKRNTSVGVPRVAQ
jgi:hypothetical protein